MVMANIQERESVLYAYFYNRKTEESTKTNSKEDRHYSFKIVRFLLFLAYVCASLIQIKRVELVNRGLVAEKDNGTH